VDHHRGVLGDLPGPGRLDDKRRSRSRERVHVRNGCCQSPCVRLLRQSANGLGLLSSHS
jgi:hypothetical protein